MKTRGLHKSFAVQIILLGLILGAVSKNYAQTAASYNFSQTTGTYTAITGGTDYTSGSNVDNAAYGGTANLLPFTFTYRGTNYTTFRIVTNGFITLGNATTPSSSVYVPMSNTSTAYNNCVSGLGADLSSRVRYEVLGTTPNRIAVIQWSNAYRYSANNTPASNENLNFQVRLYETTNVIEVIYGSCTTSNTSEGSSLGQVGIRGSSETDVNNISFTNSSLTGFSYTRNWNNLITANSNTDVVALTASLLPSSGTILRWTPSTCAQPTVSSTASSILTNGFTISWTNSGTYASGYYVRWRRVDEAPSVSSWATPTTVAAGSSSYNVTGLTSSIYYIYSVEGRCSGSSVSNISKVTTSNTTNGAGLVQTAAPCAAQPTTLSGTATSATAANLSWTAASPAPSNGYQWEVRTSGAGGSGSTGLAASGTTGAGIVTGSTSALAATTTYTLYVRSDCGTSTYSAWASSSTFTTPCAAVTSFPHSEPFAAYLPNTCWSEGDAGDLTAGPTTISSTAASWIEDGFLNSGTTGAAKINLDATGDNDWLISPLFTIPASPTYWFKYSVGATQFGATTALTTPWEADDFVQLLVSTGTTNWTVLKTYNSSNVPSHLGQLDYASLSAYAGQTVRFAFRGVEGVSNGGADIDFFVDNIFVEQMPTCIPPSAPLATAASGTTANISWTASPSNPSSGYRWELRTSGAAGSGATGLGASGTTGAGVTSVNGAGTLTGLTTYTLYVSANCGSGDTSTWVSSSTFSTPCAAITSFPHSQPFAAYLPNTCWSEGDAGDLTAGPTTISSSAASWTEDGFLNSGTTGAARINLDATGDNDWLISPLFTLPASPAYRLKYSVGATQFAATTAPTTPWESDDFVQVLVSTGTTNWTVLATYNSTNVPSHLGQIDNIDLTAYAGQTVRFSFRGVEGASNGSADIDFFIDNVVVEETPSCLSPSALAGTATSTTAANLSWTASASAPANGYEWEVRTSGAGGSGSTGLIASGTTSAGVVTAATGNTLSAGTTYTLYVRSNCGGTYSTWASSSTFATPPANDACASAVTLTVGGGTVQGNLTGATPTTGATKNDVWFKVTPTCSGNHSLSINTYSAASDKDIYIYTACPDTFGSSTWPLFSSNTANSTTSQTSNNLAFVSGTTYYILIQDFGGGGGTFNIAITGPTSQVAVSNTGSPAAGGVYPNTSNKVFFGFMLSPCGLTANFSSVTITKSGTTTTSDVSNLRVYQDINTNGAYDAGTDVLASSSAQALANSMTFSITGQSSFTGDRRYLLVGDVAVGATAGRTLTPSISSTSNVTAGGTISGTATGNTTTITPLNDLCADAIAFPTIPVDASCATVTAITAGATGSADATCSGNEDDDVWYTFTVPTGYTSLEYTITGSSGSSDRAIQILTSCGGANVGCYDPESGTITGLTAGATYLLRTYTPGTGTNATFDICLNVPPPVPSNNECSGATALVIDGTAIQGTLAGSTGTSGTSTRDVWYSITPTCNGSHNIVINTFSPSGDRDIRVYNTCITTYTTTNPPNIVSGISSSNTSESVTVTLTAGTTYYIMVRDIDDIKGTFNIYVTGPAAATTLNNTGTPSTGGVPVGQANTVLYGFQLSPCGVTANFSAVTITKTGTTTTSDISNLRIYHDVNSNGAYDAGTDVLASTAAQSLATSMTFSITGQGAFTTARRYLLVGDISSGATQGRTFTASITPNTNVTVGTSGSGTAVGNTQTIAPANDLCANAIAFPTIPTNGSCASVTASTVGASGTADATCTGNEDDDVFYTFTVPVGYTSLDYIMTDVSGNSDRVLQVLTACNGTNVGCYDNENGTLTGLTGGATYRLRAYTFNGSGTSSTFDICLSVPPVAPVNDNCAGAIELTPCGVEYGQGALGATTQSLAAGSCGGNADDDVWFKFVANATTMYASLYSTYGGVLEARSGSCNGTFIDCVDDYFANDFEDLTLTGLTIGNTYYLRVYSFISSKPTALDSIFLWVAPAGCWNGLGATASWADAGNWSNLSTPNSCASNVTIPYGTYQDPVISAASYTVGDISIAGGVNLTLTGNNLNVCGNWTGGTGSEAVTVGTGRININGTNPQTLGGKTNFNTLRVNKTSGSTSLAGGAEVNIIDALELQAGTLTTTGGSLTFKSPNENTTAILNNFSSGFTGTIAGNIIAERGFAAATAATLHKQHFFSSPVNSLPITSFASAKGINGVAVTPRSDCDERYVANTSNIGNTYEYDESLVTSCHLEGWLVRSSGNTENARGYSVVKNGSGVLSVSGAPNLGNYTRTGLTNSGWVSSTPQNNTYYSGWHLIGNPYMAYLDLDNSVNTDFDNAVQVLHVHGIYAGTFQPVTMSSSDVIAPFQGFFARKSVAGGTSTFTINASSRTNTTTAFHKNAEHQMSLQVIGNGYADITYFNFNSDATDAYDPQYDGGKMGSYNGQPTLYSIIGSVWASINSNKDVQSTPMIPVGFVPGTDATFLFQGDGFADLPNTTVYLEDLKEGIMHNLTAIPEYTFDAVTTDARERFILHFNYEAPSAIGTNNDIAISMFPNPSNGKLYINTDVKSDVKIEFTDVNGRIAYSSVLLSGKGMLDITSLPAAIYHVKITSNSSSVVKRLVKQ